MVRAKLSPEKYGLRVRTHPDGMMVTAMNKMCHAEKLELSWAGVLVQMTELPKIPARIEANARATEKFLSGFARLPEKKGPLASCVWKNVPANLVAAYMDRIEFPSENVRASGKQLATFIRKQEEQDELLDWTVVLLSNSQVSEAQQRDFAGQKIGFVKRTPESQTQNSYALRKSNILSPLDESIDLADMSLGDELVAQLAAKSTLAVDAQFLSDQSGKNLRDVAVSLTQKRIKEKPELWKGSEDTKVANGRIVRELRPKCNGLLLIYPLAAPSEVPATKVDGKETKPAEPTGLNPADFQNLPIVGLALSFPTSDTAACVEYQVNKVWDMTVQEDAEYDD